MTKLLIALASISAIAIAQPDAKPRLSPHATVSATLGGNAVKIEYGRPYLKGRSLESLAPPDQVWRLGADEATKLTTAGEIKIGDLTIPKGIYALFAVPMSGQWKLIVSKTAEQWGAFSYDAAQDLGSTMMKVSKSTVPVEQFTISLEGSGKQAALKLMWGTVVASAAVTAK